MNAQSSNEIVNQVALNEIEIEFVENKPEIDRTAIKMTVMNHISELGTGPIELFIDSLILIYDSLLSF